ncbi:MAG: metallophosphoesterase [Stenotrophobium sp.]
MRRLRILALVPAVFLAACTYYFNGLSGPPKPPSPPQVVRFLAFGDAGSGSVRQAAVGHAMAQVCAARGCDFALELGDNFYPAGVTSTSDPQFQSAFERPYAELNFPIYAVLGNHDNGTVGGEGNNNARGNIEVTYRSARWRMPARRYSFMAGGDGPQVFAEFFALDSSPLTARVSDHSPDWAPGPYAERELDWLRDAMHNSKAQWKIAFAHHPYVSNGLHGNAGNYDADLPANSPTARGTLWKDLLDKTICEQKADLYLAGHNHDLEWLKPVPACGPTQFIVSGAGSPDEERRLGDRVRNAVYWQADRAAGFFWIELKGKQLTAAAYTLTPQDALPLDAQGKPQAAFEQTVEKGQ